MNKELEAFDYIKKELEFRFQVETKLPNGMSLKEMLNYIEQALQRLAEVEKLTNLKFTERRKIADEYIKWCLKNNVVIECTTNMITWGLCIKLKEVL